MAQKTKKEEKSEATSNKQQAQSEQAKRNYFEEQLARSETHERHTVSTTWRIASVNFLVHKSRGRD
jgi:hypothetical protein